MRRSRAETPTLLWLALLGAVLAFFGAHVGRTWDFTVDDAGITYSYARNLWRGHGMVLTPGSERVEAATNFLWVLLLAPADALGVSHEALSKVLGLAFASAALGAVAIFPSVAYRRRPRLFDLAAPAVASTFAHNALWTASGLEGGPYQFFLAAALVALAREENEPDRTPWSAVALSLLFWTRPDGIMYAGAFAGAKALRAVTAKPHRQDLAWAVILALGVGSLEVFRLAYFAYPLPNSFYTKKRTFDFGKDLTSFSSAGWVYVGAFVRTYKLERALMFAPVMLLALRAPVARVALAAAVAASFFLPVYSHGDWMEEWRFLTYGTPILALAFAEAVRAAARLATAVLPRALRPLAALALTPLAVYALVKETTQSYPERFNTTRAHNTLDFETVRGRARYYAAAARALEIRRGSVLDPDVGGVSYDSGLMVVDLFGLGDIAIAHTHPVDEPGMREAIFWERRPSFVHLHGAWFGAVALERLEELEQFYIRLPYVIAGAHDDASNWVRRELLAAPWTESQHRAPAPASEAPRVDGYTLSAVALDPGEILSVELTLAQPSAGPPGTVTAEPRSGTARPISVTLRPFGDVVQTAALLPGERPWVRARLTLPAGRWEIRWRGSTEVSLGTVSVAPGAGAAARRAAPGEMRALLRAGRTHDARRLALSLRLALTRGDDPELREALGLYARALADRALTLGEHERFALAASAAQESLAFAHDDAAATHTVRRLAERLADRARSERRGDPVAAFRLARDAVLMDPRRSWMRRLAEELRPLRRNDYDGGRDLAAYRTAAAALTPTGGPDGLDRAVILLGSCDRYVEASALVDHAGAAPTSPRARLVAARGYLARGELQEVRNLAAAVPCATARDPELALGYRALAGRPLRDNDALCERPGPTPADPPWTLAAPPFDVREGSFEQTAWGTWIASGRAFGRGPIHDTPSAQTFINGWRGWRYASSYAGTNSDAGTGSLRSRPFTVRSPGLSFLIAGGADAERLGVRLRIDGRVVLRAAGNNTEGFHRVFWDLRGFQGQTAVLEIEDNAADAWGHVMVDDFIAEPAVPQG